MDQFRKKIAFIGAPISGGNYTHFKYLSKGLKDYHIDLLTVGKLEYNFLKEPNFIHLGKDINRKNHQQLALLLYEFLEKGDYSILIPMNSPIAVSLIPFIKPSIKIVNIVNGDTPRVYKYVTSHINHVSKIICVSKRQYEQLKKKLSYNNFNKKVLLIPHGIETSEIEEKSNLKEKLHIGYLGRMHQKQKNILLIPKILKKLQFDYHFFLIGEGNDKQSLIRELDEHMIPYTDYGQVANTHINHYLKEWDIFLFPSTNEGFGLTLIEAMSTGTVPIANKIEGITDYIIKDGKDGFIIDKNNIGLFVKRIEQLNKNRPLLEKMKVEAKTTIKNRFNLESVLEDYENIFNSVSNETNDKSLDIINWKPYKEYKPPFFERVINFFKNIV